MVARRNDGELGRAVRLLSDLSRVKGQKESAEMKKERVRTKREDGGRGDPRGRDEAKGWLGRAGSKGERNNPRPRAASAACPRLLAWRHQRLASRWPTISSILAWHVSLCCSQCVLARRGARHAIMFHLLSLPGRDEGGQAQPTDNRRCSSSRPPRPSTGLFSLFSAGRGGRDGKVCCSHARVARIKRRHGKGSESASVVQ